MEEDGSRVLLVAMSTGFPTMLGPALVPQTSNKQCCESSSESKAGNATVQRTAEAQVDIVSNQPVGAALPRWESQAREEKPGHRSPSAPFLTQQQRALVEDGRQQRALVFVTAFMQGTLGTVTFSRTITNVEPWCRSKELGFLAINAFFL